MKSFNILSNFMLVVLLFIIILQNIKINKKKQRLEQMKKTKDIIYFTGEQVSKAKEKSVVYEAILNAAIEIIPHATKGSILLLHEDGDFHYECLKGYSNELKSISLKKEEVYLNQINNFKDIEIIENPCEFNETFISENKTNKFKKYSALDISCTLSSPIYIDYKLVGVMSVDSTNRYEKFNEEDIQTMKYIINELELVIKNFLIQDELRYLANYDSLTNLYNRHYLRNELNSNILELRKNKNEGCLVVIDLDEFKDVNDTYGHVVGDEVLIYFAKVLMCNIDGGHIYGRMSGDEFVILFKELKIDEVTSILNKIRKILKDNPIKNKVVSFSYGISIVNNETNLDINELFAIADKRMYDDKKNKVFRIA